MNRPAAEVPLVYIVDADPDARASVRGLLESSGLRVAEYAMAEHFLASADPQAAACVILEVRMPGLSGLELQDELLRCGLAVPLVFLTGHGAVRSAVTAVKKGAVDFLEKPCDDAVLVATVERAIRLKGPAFESRTRQLSAAARTATLTQREREVMERVVAGKPNKLIAEELAISVKTVEAHRARVMEKTGADSLPGLVQIALDAQAAAS